MLCLLKFLNATQFAVLGGQRRRTAARQNGGLETKSRGMLTGARACDDLREDGGTKHELVGSLKEKEPGWLFADKSWTDVRKRRGTRSSWCLGEGEATRDVDSVAFEEKVDVKPLDEICNGSDAMVRSDALRSKRSLSVVRDGASSRALTMERRRPRETTKLWSCEKGKMKKMCE